MNALDAPEHHRSEAFAEDLAGFVVDAPQPAAPRQLASLLNWLPLAVAVLGVATAVLPPWA